MRRSAIHIGDLIDGRFELLAEIGEGGMGRVYEAVDRRYERAAAVKVLGRRFAGDREYRARFEREASGAERVNHPHVLPVWAYGQDGDCLYLATPLCDTDLAMLVYGERGRLDAHHALRILKQIAWALDWAHGRGVVHRDVKPENMLLITGPSGEHAYLADFGLAKAESDVTLTRVGHAPGLSPAYAAPEQWMGLEAGPQADQYALAATLFACLSGRPPYHGAPDIGAAHASARPPVLDPALVPQASELSRVIARGLAKPPEDRFDSCGALIDAAEVAANGTVTAPPRLDLGTVHAVPTVVESQVPAPTVTEAVSVPAGPTPPTELEAAEVTELGDAGETELDAAEATELEHGTSAPTPAGAGRRAPIAIVLAAVAAVLAVVAGGFGLGRATRSEPHAAAAVHGQTGRSGGASLTVPGGWTRAAAPTISGLPLRSAAAYQSPGPAPGTVVLGAVSGAVGPALLPSSFAAALSPAASTRDRVRLGRVESYRQRAVKVPGVADPVTVFSAQDSRHAVVVLCIGGTAGFGDTCESAAATLSLPGALPVGADPRLARAVGAAMRPLQNRRRIGRRDLGRARNARAQATAAGALAGGYAAAAKAMRRVPASAVARPSVGVLAATLHAAARDYEALSRSAARRDTRAYARARHAIDLDDAAVSKALARLETLGYRIVR